MEWIAFLIIQIYFLNVKHDYNIQWKSQPILGESALILDIGISIYFDIITHDFRS